MTLQRAFVIYETEVFARARLEHFGYAPEIAAEIAVYLGQCTDLPDFFADIEAGARGQGFTVEFVELDHWLERAARARSDLEKAIVWSISNGVRYYRGASVAALSRLAGIARFGAPATTQHLAQDKFATLALAAASGLPTPPTVLIEGRETVAALGELGRSGPFFVKPNRLGAKIGIFADSRCATLDEAADRAARIWERYRDRAVVQPFVRGDDVRVSFLDLGGDFAAQLGIERLAKDPRSETGGDFMTMKDNETLSGARDATGARGAFGVTREAAYTPQMVDLKSLSEPAARRAAAEIEDFARRLARTIDLCDYFSMDFRVDPEGRPTFFEFETGPGVTIYDFQSYLARVHGLSLGEALARAMLRAFNRSSRIEEA
jgi:D-alanine-D-alanine ligase